MPESGCRTAGGRSANGRVQGAEGTSGSARAEADWLSFSSVSMKRKRAEVGKGKLLGVIRGLFEERGELLAGSSWVLHVNGGVIQSYSRCANGREREHAECSKPIASGDGRAE